MNYKLTCYCSACNYPKGTRNVAYNPNDKDKKKGMPTQATAGFTVAVSKSKYKEDQGKRIELYILDKNENVISSHQPFIMDFHGKGSEIIDFYIGEREKCECSKHPWSGKKCNFIYLD
jgi:hypothetical protein